MAFSQGGCSIMFDMRPPSHFIWFPLCGQFQSSALAGGWRSPRSQMPEAQPQEGGRAGSGEKVALRLPGDRRSVCIVPLGQDLDALHADCGEAAIAPAPGLRGPQLGPLGQTGADTTSHPAACKRCRCYPRRWRSPGQELTWSSRGAVPLER